MECIEWLSGDRADIKNLYQLRIHKQGTDIELEHFIKVKRCHQILLPLVCAEEVLQNMYVDGLVPMCDSLYAVKKFSDDCHTLIVRLRWRVSEVWYCRLSRRRAAAIKPPIPPTSKTPPVAFGPHNPTSWYLISRCSAGRSVIPCTVGRSVTDPRARRSLMIRWGSGSKPPRNKPLIYRRAASRKTFSKTIWDQISVDPPRCPPAAKDFYILERRKARWIFSERER
ncbi:hypothetical protein T12_11789 [Trichinella patagoniensis]|uniref:Uncharacterized protein n=1 Tax=Trichinella patagoniensis TaxID=990121 RepID=A0A0V0Z3X5_9BILA|nr:hypothetical protein T12_11789 [Trichinella patagoniensis]